MLATSKIARLDRASGYQLEAEQVIVDVSSVLKELIENSLDAKATSIEIILVNFGSDKILLSDDGEGITKENLENLASSRYATSKIETDADLETSENYGFRGEALHSLVTLSESVSVLTCTEESGSGLCKQFSKFGTRSEIAVKPRAKGTTVVIEGLFAGISVRKLDWFKRKAQLMAQAVFLAQSYAIMSVGVKMSFSHINDAGTKTTIFVSRGLDPKSNHADCFGTRQGQLSKQFSSEFSIMESPCQLQGLFVSNPASKNFRLVVFINEKPFESPKWNRSIQQMLKKNYSSGIEYFLKLSIPMLWLDFNASPDKRTIYLLHEKFILDSILKCCECILQESSVSSIVSVQNTIKNSAPTEVAISKADCCYDACLMSMEAAESVEMRKEDIIQLIPIGQFNNGFIVCTKLDGDVNGLYAVDQHAADERIRYEEISKKYSITSQRLVAPVKLSLDAEQEDVFNSHEATIFEAGFKLRVDDNHQLLLEAVPSFHGIECDINDFYDLLSYFKDHGRLYRNLCPKFQRVLAYKACRSAIMIGSPLTNQQMQTILDKLAQTDFPWICAHGRPTVQFLKNLSTENQE